LPPTRALRDWTNALASAKWRGPTGRSARKTFASLGYNPNVNRPRLIPAASHLVMHLAREAVVRWTVVTTLLTLSIYHLALTASTVLAFSLRYPLMDQFRPNLRYLTIPFPQSGLLLENGHRPVLPGVVRFVALNWFRGT
jgi:hypothetical protein